MLSGSVLSFLLHSFLAQAAPYPVPDPAIATENAPSTSAPTYNPIGGLPEPVTTSVTQLNAQAVAPTSVSIAAAAVSTPTATVTVFAKPHTITVHAEAVTVTQTASSAGAVVAAAEATPSSTAWAAPAQFTDLTCFNITKFACGEDNIQLIEVAPQNSDVTDPSDPATAQSTSSQTGLQAFYPQGSINPGNSAAPDGGADFYASPLDLSQATNVSFEYSVFFPAGFDFVLGGKLPGLYGGRPGCSGGDPAEDCFSTRMMWRTGGAGEMYLYAPKTKQGPSVCSTPPTSDCNAEYGLSIGRGSFKFVPGSWTTMLQTVGLNTPGQADGSFSLDVDGQRVMTVDEVFYREAPGSAAAASAASVPPSASGLKALVGGSPGASTKRARPNARQDQSQSPLLISLSAPAAAQLDPVASDVAMVSALAADVTEDVSRPGFIAEPEEAGYDDIEAAGLMGTLTEDDLAAILQASLSAAAVGPTLTLTASIEHTVILPALIPTVTHTVPNADAPAVTLNIESAQGGASSGVPFVGIFFSTFFGGHDPKYASPKDQKTWFKDFSLVINE